MSRKIQFIFPIWLLLLFVSLKTNAQPVLDLAKTTTFDISQNRFYYEDQTGKLTFEDIKRSEIDKKFQVSDKEDLNYGFTNSAIWLKIKLKNSNLKKDDYLAVVGYPILNEVDFYFQQLNQNDYVAFKSGNMRPFTERLINHRKFLFPLHFTDTSTHILYIRVASKSTMPLPVEIISKSDFEVKSAKDELGYGIFYGILLIMIAYNFFVFLSLKDLNYLYYIISIFGSFVLFFSIAGHQTQYLFPQYPLFANQIIFCGSAFIIIGLSLFAVSFNEVRKYSLVVYGLLWSLAIIGIIIFVLTLLKPYWFGEIGLFTNVLGLFLAVIILSSSIYCFKKGHKASRFFILAFSFYLFGIIVLVMKNLGVVPVNFFTNNAGEIGASLEVLFLSFALSDKYNLYKTQKEAAQQELIAVEKEAKETLEQKVQQRTAQLQKANDELATLNEETSQQAEEITTQRDVLSNTMKELNKQKESIISSINYAKTIQTAILPFEGKISRCLENFFIFYKPRDIVSGDFYFFEDKGTHLILGALDCTGHGVPGAFMSMIGQQILSDIVNVKNIYSPDLILEELHKGIRSALQQDQNQNRDGMDAVIVSIKKNNSENTNSKFEYLEYAGAMNPLYYVQKSLVPNTDQKTVSQVIKGNKYSIGGREKGDKVRKFDKHRIELAGYKTKFWLCTDGYQDQFGGEENRKFMVKNFRELLFSLQDTSIQEQKKTISSVFEEWKGLNQQVDDILVIGLEI